MIGKIVKIINKSNFGFVKAATNEEFYFKFEDFKFKNDLIELKVNDEIRFYEGKVFNGKNKNALSIYKIVRVRDITNKYPIKEDEIIRIAKQLNIENILNKHSYMSLKESEEIIRYFQEKNNQKANINNPNFKKTKSNSDKTTLEEYIKNGYLLFIDTSSLMNYNMLEILNNAVIPFLKNYDKKIYIVDSVIYEIQNHLTKRDGSVYKQAKSAQYILDILAKSDLYVIPNIKGTNKKFADEELISCFTLYRTKYNLCLITNDNKYKEGGKLAGSIKKLSQDPNIRKIRDIKVFYINNNKNNPQLAEFSFDRDSNFALHRNAPKRVEL